MSRTLGLLYYRFKSKINLLKAPLKFLNKVIAPIESMFKHGSMFRLFTYLFIFFLLPLTTLALPKTIILLRHAEKPSFGPELSEKGWLRAKALSKIFDNEHELYGIEKPDFLFAAGPVKQDSSIRSIQTLKYLSEETKVNVDASFNRDQYAKLSTLFLVNQNLIIKLSSFAGSTKF